MKLLSPAAVRPSLKYSCIKLARTDATHRTIDCHHASDTYIDIRPTDMSPERAIDTYLTNYECAYASTAQLSTVNNVM